MLCSIFICKIRFGFDKCILLDVLCLLYPLHGCSILDLLCQVVLILAFVLPFTWPMELARLKSPGSELMSKRSGLPRHRQDLTNARSCTSGRLRQSQTSLPKVKIPWRRRFINTSSSRARIFPTSANNKQQFTVRDGEERKCWPGLTSTVSRREWMTPAPERRAETIAPGVTDSSSVEQFNSAAMARSNETIELHALGIDHLHRKWGDVLLYIWTDVGRNWPFRTPRRGLVSNSHSMCNSFPQYENVDPSGAGARN